MKHFALVLLLAGLAAPLAGCVIVPAHGGAPYAGAHWVAGHYGPAGEWHPGHWA